MPLRKVSANLPKWLKPQRKATSVTEPVPATRSTWARQNPDSGGQSGLQLGIGLLKAGNQVHIVPNPDGSGVEKIDWTGKLDRNASSVDQRVKIPRWMA